MTQDEQIDNIITASINIIELEIHSIQTKQTTKPLSKDDTDRVIDFLKTLVIVQKDKRLSIKENQLDIKSMDMSELDLAIEKETERLKSIDKT